ncbi:hypothetical protein ECG_04773 [Echinococcus granulosus]|uniref:Uncharacterized protein n=1 Tax=Echinococcus granulosus TaxID=6210 RepID=W6V925_ECHGR|nr:hypothetical protein EGR_02148 [Echinococcus granulosus]EUB63054.1 hypothetical protein EGR_02148 [Echinococcus granulosus]KAH9282473.1 hypothetical protein ECG_04773 [Echinococcus granulosus]
MACPVGPYDQYCFERRKCVHFSFCSRYDKQSEPPKDRCFRGCSDWRKRQPRTVPLKTTLVATGYPPENWIVKRCRRTDIKWPGTSKPVKGEGDEDEEDGEECEEMMEDPCEAGMDFEGERGTNNASAVSPNRNMESPSFSELHMAGDGTCAKDGYLEENVLKLPPQENNLLRMHSNSSLNEKTDLQFKVENYDNVGKNREVEIQVDIRERQLHSPEKKLEPSVKQPPILRQKQSALKRIFNNISSIIKTGSWSNHESTLVPLQNS